MVVVMGTHEINAHARASRKLPRFVPGAKMWNVPCRWWEPDDYPPERVTVIRADPAGLASAYCHFPGDEFNSYLFGADLFHTEAEARAEMATRTSAMDAENDAIAEQVLRRALAGENWIDVLLEVST